MVKSIVLYQPKIVTINFSPQIIFRSFWSSLPEPYSPSSSRAKFSLPLVGYLAYKLIFWISFPSLSDSFYILQRRKISGTSVGQVAMQIGLPYVICYSDCMVVEQKKVSATVSTQQHNCNSTRHRITQCWAWGLLPTTLRKYKEVGLRWGELDQVVFYWSNPGHSSSHHSPYCRLLPTICCLEVLFYNLLTSSETLEHCNTSVKVLFLAVLAASAN